MSSHHGVWLAPWIAVSFQLIRATRHGSPRWRRKPHECQVEPKAPYVCCACSVNRSKVVFSLIFLFLPIFCPEVALSLGPLRHTPRLPDFVLAVHSAIDSGDLSAVELALAQGSSILDQPGPGSSPLHELFQIHGPLHKAAESGSPGIERAVASWCRDRAAAMRKDAIGWAASAGNASGVRILLPLYCESAESQQRLQAALFSAASRGLLACVELLAPRCDLNQANAHGETALMLAAHRGDLACAQFLAARCDARLRTKQGLCALDIAAVNGSDDMVRALLPFSDPLAQTPAGLTPLMQATISHRVASMEALLPFGGAWIPDRDGKFAFERAFRTADHAAFACADLLGATATDLEQLKPMLDKIQHVWSSTLDLPRLLPATLARHEALQLAQEAGISAQDSGDGSPEPFSSRRAARSL